MKYCPHCQTELIPEIQNEPAVIPISKPDWKTNLICHMSAFIITLFAMFVWSLICMIIVNKIIGTDAAFSISVARHFYCQSGLLLLLVVTLVLSILSVVLSSNKRLLIALTVIISLLAGFIGFILEKSNISTLANMDYLMMYLFALAPAFGFTFPVILGSFSLASFEKSIKKAIKVQLLQLLAFLLLSSILIFILSKFFALGVTGVTIANIITALVLLIAAVLLSK